MVEVVYFCRDNVILAATLLPETRGNGIMYMIIA